MTDVQDAILAGIASGDNALEQMGQVITHLERAGFVIVPREPTGQMVLLRTDPDTWRRMINVALGGPRT